MRLAIVDDEALARGSLRAMLLALGYGPQIVGEAHSVASAVDMVRSSAPDLLLMDIWLGDGTGFDVLERLGAGAPKVIFITAYDQYAIKAFEQEAIHYLLKPVASYDLKRALERVARNVHHNGRVPSEPDAGMGRIHVPSTEGYHFIQRTRLIRCESDGNYTRLYLMGGERILASRTLKDFQALLSPHGFVRVHHSHLVNLDEVRSYLHRDGGLLLLSDGTEVPVSYRKRSEVLEALGRTPT